MFFGFCNDQPARLSGLFLNVESLELMRLIVTNAGVSLSRD